MADTVRGTVPATATRGGGYLTTLTAFAAVAVAASAFDSVTRNLTLPLILKDLHLTVGVGSDIVGGGFAITAIWNWVIGPLADRRGRKRAFQATLAAAGLFSGLTSIVTQQWEYVIIAILSGACLVVQTSAEVLIAEEAPPRFRGLMMGIVIAMFSGGVLVVGLLGNVLLPSGHWRVMYVIAFFPLVLAVLAEFCIKEPERSKEVLRLRKAGDAELTHRVNVEKARQSTWRQLFAPDLRRQTIIMSAGGFFVNATPVLVLALSATYFTLYDHLPIGSIAGAVTLEAVAALAGGLLVGFASDYIAPRTLMVTFSLAGAVAIALMARHGGTSWMIFTMVLFGFFGQGALGTWPRFISDSFPTRARGTAQGFVVGMFFASNIISPVIYGNMMGAGEFAGTCAVAAASAALGAVILAFGRAVPVRAELEDISQ
ncbi:MAG: MFS transporter [Streptosporangiales bacterium]|nr:MFS transporter [Streptosporangiales bacterium]